MWSAKKRKKSLEVLTLVINNIRIDLKRLKTLIRSIGTMSELRDLGLDVKINKKKNQLNMLKCFCHVASLS